MADTGAIAVQLHKLVNDVAVVAAAVGDARHALPLGAELDRALAKAETNLRVIQNALHDLVLGWPESEVVDLTADGATTTSLPKG